MTIPFWCLAIACLLPFVWFSIEAPLRKAQFGAALDNSTPRPQAAKLEGRAARAHGAHANSFEAIVYFAPAVVIAHLVNADATWTARLAVAFVVLRLLHGFFYLGDKPALRTASFAMGLLCVIGLFVTAARA